MDEYEEISAFDVRRKSEIIDGAAIRHDTKSGMEEDSESKVIQK